MSALTPKNEISLEYLAGLMDGEGCIASNGHTGYTVKISMNHTAENLLRKVHSTFGGKFRKYFSIKSGWMYNWTLENKADIKRVLSLVLPFMQLEYKIEKSIQALAWCDTIYKQQCHLNVEVQSKCMDCGAEIITYLPKKNCSRCESCRENHMTYYWKMKWKERKPTYVRAHP